MEAGIRLTVLSCFRCSISIKLPRAADRRVGSATILPGPEPDSQKQAASSGSSAECRGCLLAAAGWLRAPHTEVGSKRCLRARDSTHLAGNKIAGRPRALLRPNTRGCGLELQGFWCPWQRGCPSFASCSAVHSPRSRTAIEEPRTPQGPGFQKRNPNPTSQLPFVPHQLTACWGKSPAVSPCGRREHPWLRLS